MVTTPAADHVVSASGAVYPRGDDGANVVIGGRLREGFWALPKGSPIADETLEATALRQGREETGLDVAIEKPVGALLYEFTGPQGRRYDKRMQHFLMAPTGGQLEAHDAAFDAVRWASIEEALGLLRYPNEREIVRKAARLIGARGSV
jgi:8-oxo-dGTP pyrophosphatase MutT (NUDIX family)